MIAKMKQWFCLVRSKNPARFVLYCIGLFNLFVLGASTLLILLVQQACGSGGNFFLQVYYTALVMINAGSINDIIDRTGAWNTHMVFLAVFYLVLIFITMVSFTGALIGYLTNKISSFVERSNAGAHKLNLEGHTLILNWNSRAAEIINDMLYKQKREIIVILVQEDKERIETEIRDRLDDTKNRENRRLRADCAQMPLWKRHRVIHKQKLRNRLTVLVRQGEFFAAERLTDVSIAQAKSILLLSRETTAHEAKGALPCETDDCSTVKLLIQVAELTGDGTSRDHQRVIVEVTNRWTMDLVRHIIEKKQMAGKAKITAVPVHHILGDILAQFAIMPDLNLVYGDLFSYRGAEFFTKPVPETDEESFIRRYLPGHAHALPLTVMQSQAGSMGYFIADEEAEIDRSCEDIPQSIQVSLQENYQIGPKRVVILGHNAKSAALMEGLAAFNAEWQSDKEHPVLEIVVIDSDSALRQMNHYQEYPLVQKTVTSDVFGKDAICTEIQALIAKTDRRLSILILSDDALCGSMADRNVFTHIIYIQSAINAAAADPAFDPRRIDVVAEVSNPKNADIVANYSVNYVIISNRYISRLFNHLSEKDCLYSFLADVLTFDVIGEQEAASKEIYLKRAGDFFAALPEVTTARQLIRAVYDASPAHSKAMLIGYVTAGKQLVPFSGDQRSRSVKLTADDQLVIFCNH